MPKTVLTRHLLESGMEKPSQSFLDAVNLRFDADVLKTAQFFMNTWFEYGYPSLAKSWFSEGDLDHDSAIKDYIKFLRLRHEDATLKPTPLLWCIWHSHILRSKSYVATCRLLFGKIVDHDIFLDMPGEPSELEVDIDGTRDAL